MKVYYFISQRIRSGLRGSFSSLVSNIAVGIIALGMVISILSCSILEGFKSEIENKIYGLSGHIMVTKFDLNRSFEESPFNKNRYIYLHPDSVYGVQAVQPIIHKPGLIKSNNEIVGVILKGVEKNYNWELFNKNIVEGRTPAFSDTAYSKEVMISRKIADNLHTKLNDTILLCFVQESPRFRKVQVSGIYETGLEEFDDHMIMGDARLIRRLYNLSDSIAGSYEITVNDFSQLDSTAASVEENLDYDLAYMTVKERYMQIFDWMMLLDRNVLVFLVLIIGVGTFVMVATLLIMIMERTSMIGLLKALGARNYQVRRIFLLNGAYLVFKGLLFGNSIGFLLCWLQYQFKLMPLDPDTYYMSSVPIAWTWFMFIVLNAVYATLLMLIQLLPVIMVSQINPAKSVKFN
ncbi:MAG TPA: FtsX-like permease family protein [Cytophagaceae bacterium]|nr:FtsX-like permease family protein [Cytophagaceae bacterium]